jgi:hypothetical protein
VGLKTAVTPVARELVLKVTSPVKPARGTTVIWYCADEPGTTFLVAGRTLIEKSGVVDAGAAATNVL